MNSKAGITAKLSYIICDWLANNNIVFILKFLVTSYKTKF